VGTLLPELANTPAGMLMAERAAVQQLIKYNLAEAKEFQKLAADKRTSDVELNVGDRVRIDTKGIKLAGQPGKAFRQRFIGPYAVKEKLSSIIYKLELPPALHLVHPVFHISKLQRWRDDTENPGRYVSAARAGVHADVARGEFEIEKITAVKIAPHGNEPHGDSLLFKVRWTNYDSSEDTWEPYHDCGRRGGGLQHTEAVQQFFQTADWLEFARTDAYLTLRSQYVARVPTAAALRAAAPVPAASHTAAGVAGAPVPVRRTRGVRGRSGDGPASKRPRRH
jgi:hypothetical protein